MIHFLISWLILGEIFMIPGTSGAFQTPFQMAQTQGILDSLPKPATDFIKSLGSVNLPTSSTSSSQNTFKHTNLNQVKRSSMALWNAIREWLGVIIVFFQGVFTWILSVARAIFSPFIGIARWILEHLLSLINK